MMDGPFRILKFVWPVRDDTVWESCVLSRFGQWLATSTFRITFLLANSILSHHRSTIKVDIYIYCCRFEFRICSPSTSIHEYPRVYIYIYMFSLRWVGVHICGKYTVEKKRWLLNNATHKWLQAFNSMSPTFMSDRNDFGPSSSVFVHVLQSSAILPLGILRRLFLGFVHVMLVPYNKHIHTYFVCLHMRQNEWKGGRKNQHWSILVFRLWRWVTGFHCGQQQQQLHNSIHIRGNGFVEQKHINDFDWNERFVHCQWLDGLKIEMFMWLSAFSLCFRHLAVVLCYCIVYCSIVWYIVCVIKRV